jgi:hypothetical protein
MPVFYISYPVLGGSLHYVPTAQGEKEKAIAEAEKWIEANRLDGEKWEIQLVKK